MKACNGHKSENGHQIPAFKLEVSKGAVLRIDIINILLHVNLIEDLMSAEILCEV